VISLLRVGAFFGALLTMGMIHVGSISWPAVLAVTAGAAVTTSMLVFLCGIAAGRWRLPVAWKQIAAILGLAVTTGVYLAPSSGLPIAIATTVAVGSMAAPAAVLGGRRSERV
jgi:hypothetical protein